LAYYFVSRIFIVQSGWRAGESENSLAARTCLVPGQFVAIAAPRAAAMLSRRYGDGLSWRDHPN